MQRSATHRQRRASSAQRGRLRGRAHPRGALSVEAFSHVSQPLRQDEHHARVVRQHVPSSVAPTASSAPSPRRGCSGSGSCSSSGRSVLQRVDALATVPDGGADLGFDAVAFSLGGATRLGVVSAASGCEGPQRRNARAHARRAARKVGALRRWRRCQQRGLRRGAEAEHETLASKSVRCGRRTRTKTPARTGSRPARCASACAAARSSSVRSTGMS